MTEPITIAEYRRRVAKDMSEETLRVRVKALAKSLGWISYHTQNSRRSDPGWPDMAMVHPVRGRFMVRELKTMRGRLTPEQREWLDGLTHAGVDAGLWRPIHLLDDTVFNELSA